MTGIAVTGITVTGITVTGLFYALMTLTGIAGMTGVIPKRRTW